MNDPVVRDYEYYRTLPPERYPEELAFLYQKRMGKPLDLEHPKTYDEKVQWLKLYNNTPEKTLLADKYRVRDWVAERIGEKYLIPLLGVWDSADKIDFDALPDQFVLKANHGCGWNIVVQDKRRLLRDEARAELDYWLHRNFALCAGLELHYADIKPVIIAEAYLENDGGDLYDYKVFCFNGKAKYVMFLSERKNGLKMAFYDTHWNRLHITYNYPENEHDIPRPACLEQLLTLAEKLSEGQVQSRVDFYVLDDGTIKFGEITLTSASGFCHWNPPETDRMLGDLFDLPEKKLPLPEKSFAERGVVPEPEGFKRVETDAFDRVRELEQENEKLGRLLQDREGKLQSAWANETDLRTRLQTAYQDKSEINAKLQQTYEEKSELNAKLQQTYAEKSEINAKLQQTYQEKSELNAKLKQTYQEKFDRGVEIRELKQQVDQLRREKKTLEGERREQQKKLRESEAELSRVKQSKSYKLGHILTEPWRRLK